VRWGRRPSSLARLGPVVDETVLGDKSIEILFASVCIRRPGVGILTGACLVACDKAKVSARDSRCLRAAPVARVRCGTCSSGAQSEGT
jgi:hypothetical protein